MSAEQDPDAALMMRVKQGDSVAFAELVDKIQAAGDERRLPDAARRDGGRGPGPDGLCAGL